ncbi:cadherin-like domain-containing protein [Aliivibrio sifiae]|uniref:cadherin-like domain-containing protein n=1 Tax=Aliivibrio sifiae TaxID=566293 RepID=UPI003D12FB54
MFRIRLNIFFVLIPFLYGCGGESNNESKPNENDSATNINIYLNNTQIKSTPQKVEVITILAESDEGAALELSNVNVLNDNDSCYVDDIHELSFSIYSQDIGECRYEYTVVPQNKGDFEGENRAIARVSVSETAQENTVTSINKETNLETDVVIYIEAELSSELSDSDYNVVDDVTIVGSGFAHVNTIENTITYTPEAIGVSEILYSMSDGEDTLLGSIYVSVSDAENTPPVANDYKKEGIISKGTMIEIDLSDVISDEEDEDEVKLDTVKAYNANVSITSFTDHTFTFESDTPGGHEITYTVSDGRGGYAVAQVYIEVEADFSLIQDWEDITVYDSYIDSDITFTAPTTSTFADYTNSNYDVEYIENGESGPNGAKIAMMTYEQATNYCQSRGGRLPLIRELELLVSQKVYENHNWPASKYFWSANKNSINSALAIDLLSGDKEINSDSLYTTCVLITNGVNDFVVNHISEQNADDDFNTTRFLDAYIIDPDGNPASYHKIIFESRSGNGGFGTTNNDVKVEEYSDVDGIATEVYEFTSGYEDNVFAMSNKNDFGQFYHLELEQSGFDPTNPDDWNVAKIYGSTDLGSYEPLISDDGTKFSLGSIQQYMTSISKTSLIGNEITVIFGVDRSQATNLSAGNSNIIFQQVSSKAPDINSECDISIYGDCSWSGGDKDTAGFPSNDDRWFGFVFDYYAQTIKLKDSSGELISATLTNRGISQLYYKINIENGVVNIYQNTTENFENIKPDIVYNIERMKINTSKFFYFGLSGGAHGNNGVFGTINYLHIY